MLGPGQAVHTLSTCQSSIVEKWKAMQSNTRLINTHDKTSDVLMPAPIRATFTIYYLMTAKCITRHHSQQQTTENFFGCTVTK